MSLPIHQTRFPVILLFDRQNERSFGYILRSIDYLTSTEQMPAANTGWYYVNHAGPLRNPA